ncbi:catechol 2,3-dioxygenase-like lactoylglutathione lyase family enzyme [Microbacteriaceae bacterium SG_E_30_P1]|uniref:Catechol 2,3-dioxygenase-like lactoylglutathione lyase family enzyme n=1 Tax=Antiquaquibacter oligotrophicus TaxID=2880260 RepID=A0ABT6KRY5_9MICO|nr:VOC family protein [Antiquaquibacter oligotrophicus]MDH6182560.1 catechol 2,3-dioxygenase-like lactoylglutathione lyase family enzyme [Antiquaquibacter oligotrophicus]UDF14473.1 VOC family protein [Antiquaquibacter oligotrophicus]
MKITAMTIFVDDQQKALDFYTNVLGFVPIANVPLGEHSWITVASPEAPDATQISLEPKDHPAVTPFTDALVGDGIPWTSFGVDDVQTEYERLVERGVVFTQPPTNAGPVTIAVFDDTVGNLIQIAGMNA